MSRMTWVPLWVRPMPMCSTRWTRRGHSLTIGARSADRTSEVAKGLTKRLDDVAGAGEVEGATNVQACEDADVVLLAVPNDGHDDLVSTLPCSGKTVIACVNSLAFDKRGAHGIVIDNGGVRRRDRAAAGPGGNRRGTFHHVSAVTLCGEDDYLADEDVLVVGDDTEAKQAAMGLARCATGRDGIDASMLRLAQKARAVTAVLISANRRYKTHSGNRAADLRR